MSDKKLFLLDAMALIYRAHFAFIKTPRINSKGVNTSAVFGFTNFLLDLLNKEKPTHLAIAFDMPGPTFRHEQYPAYKAQRDEVPEDIITAIPLTKRLCRALNIPLVEMAGYEADDLIGTLARRAESHGYKTYMVTPDKDYAQLVTDNILLYKPGRSGGEVEILDPKGVEESMGVPPALVPDFLGLKGDAVDNIPGVPKVGDKTAIELIKEFGTVENIIARAADIRKNSIRETVITHAEQGLLSKKLAIIITDAPVSWEEKDLAIGNPNRDELIELLQELEFKATAERILKSALMQSDDAPVQRDLFGNATESQPTETLSEEPGAETEPLSFESGFKKLSDREHQYQLLETKEEIQAVIDRVRVAGQFCFDTETTSLDPLTTELVAFTLSIKPHEAWLIHFPEGEKKTNEDKLNLLRQILESNELLKIGQNLKFDILVLRTAGVNVAGPFYDTMLASYIINPDKPHGMDAMSRELLEYDPISITELIGKKGKGQLSMRHVALPKLVDYACEDADITLALQQVMNPALDEGRLRTVFEEVEMPLMPVLAQMEFTGIKVDEAALFQYSKDLESEMNVMERRIYDLAGMKFNINSPRQLGEILFTKLGLGGGKKTKTGQLSTKEEVLVELAAEHELPAVILRYRKFGKLKSTYVDALPALINGRTGRLHTTYAQAVAATGRLSSNNPNLQNIPIRSEEGREIRKAFIPEAGFTILSADYSQVELRIMAALSGDESMREDFLQGHDIHRATASRVFGVPLAEVTDDMRSKAKMVNFGIIYGISAFGLAQRLRIPRGEASEIIKAYFEKYPGIKAAMDASVAFAREHGYVETLSGRRRYLPDIHSQNNTIKGFAERTAINTPVQGTAADLIKVAMIAIHHEIKHRKLQSRMLLQVHDELVFEAHESEVEQLSALIRDKMENALPMSVPMKVEIGTGINWLEAH